MVDLAIRPGIGIYTRPEAARLLGMTPSRLRRWVSGYTYWLQDADGRLLRRRPSVINTDLPSLNDAVALSFLELMELRVVKAIVDKGVPLQRVRDRAKVAAERFGTEHPFASRRVFTDGRDIFSAVAGDLEPPNVVRWRRDDIDQVVSGAVFEQFLDEIEFDQGTALAHRWWPMGRDAPIVLDPRIRFGAPVIEGTAVRTTVVARMAAKASAEDAAIAYELQLQQAVAAVQFEAELAAA